MLENVVAWVLNTYIGEYLEDLNTNQLSLAILSGQLELENVPLKTTALRKLDLPLEVKSGLLGRLTLSVPITRIRSEPWTLTLTDVLVILGPPPADRKYDVQATEEVEHQRKEILLTEVEQKHKGELSTLLGLPQTASQDTWWGASLISTILNNIQLIMTNVHIRYEDDITLPRAFNCGVRIQKLTMQTTNSTWKPGFIEPQDGQNVFKKLELKGFSLYWNSDTQPTKDISDSKKLRDILAPETWSNSYIIHPCSAELRMERNLSKFPLKTTPRFKFFLKPDKIVCELTRKQMAELRALNREWARFEISRQHRKWRPITSIRSHSKDWWRFAFSRILDERRKQNTRRTWSFAYTRARHFNAYCQAYKRRLLDFVNMKPSGEAPTVSVIVSQDDNAIMKQIERDNDYTFPELQLFRETVFRQVVAEKEKELGISAKTDDTFETLDSPGEIVTDIDSLPQVKQEGKGLYGWITGFFVSDEPTVMENDPNYEFSKIDLSELKSLPKPFNVKDVEEEILDVLHETWDDSTILRRDAMLADIALRLDHVTLRFIDSDDVSGIEQRRILALDCSGVSAQLELSPRQHSINVQLSVDDMSIQRLYSAYSHPMSNEKDESLFYGASEATKILLAIGKQDEEEKKMEFEPIFRLQYRRMAPKLTVKHIVEGRFRPISIIYEENAFDGLSSLFSDDPSLYKSAGSILPSETYSDNLTESHVFVNLHIPSIHVELRQQSWSSPQSQKWDAGEPFVCVILQDVILGISSKEKYLSQLKIDLGNVEMKDLLENQEKNLILKTGTDIESSSASTQTLFSAQVHQPIRKTSTFESNNAEIQFFITLIDSKHSLFESKYKNNCKIDVVMNDLTVGMSRRTWTALMDLFGFLGDKEATTNTMKGDSDTENVSIEFTLRLQSLVVDMLYPANSTRLGFINLSKPELLTKISSKGSNGIISTTLLVEGIQMEDHMPLYSELYKEKIRVVSDAGGIVSPKAEFHITKYLGADPMRDCDVSVSVNFPKNMHVYYIHTHRFFMALLEFWLHFNELHHIVANSKERSTNSSTRLSRVFLDIDIVSPTTIILPLNQFSDQVLIFDSTGVNVKNSFVNLSCLKHYFHEYCIETTYDYDSPNKEIDCLLDHLKINLLNISAFEGVRIMKIHNKEKVSLGPATYREIFEYCDFQIISENVFNKKFDLSTEILRNLDGALSHNAPDMAAIMLVSNLTWTITTDFYILFRGILEKNFGDPLIPVAETIPIEILQKPPIGCEVINSQKYATLSFRLIFKDMVLDCQVPDAASFIPFAKANLKQARISFDLFIDGLSELDVISASSQLVDTRKGHEKNIFNTILQPMENSQDDSNQLMFEAHMVMKKDELPQLTLVLMNARVIVLPEWLNDAKDFLSLSSSFVPKYWEDVAQIQIAGGVVGRVTSLHAPMPVQTFAVKVTLKNSNLYLLENTFDPNTFACVATVTAVLNISDPGGDMNANLEIGNLMLGWCTMKDEEHTMNLCSNDFSIGVMLYAIPNLTNSIPGLPQLSTKKHILEFELRGIIGRLTYRDVTVISTSIKGFLEHFKAYFGKSLIPVMKHHVLAKPLHIDRIGVTAAHSDLWLLDEYLGVSIPMLRLSLSELNFDSQLDRITSRFHISADYFNHRMFGWEPLVEKWKILRFLCQTKDKLKTVELITETHSPLNITITEQFMQQSIHFMDRWPAIRAALERDDFRNICAKTRADHLPYIFKNETGCEVDFTTAVEDVLANRQGLRKASARWVTVAPGKLYHFAFPSKLLLYSQSEREPSRQLLLRVTGWDEITPISVDASGVYFRVVTSLKMGVPNARLVIRVQMEKDGRKLVSVRSSMEITNSLPQPIQVSVEDGKHEIMTIESTATLPVPLLHAHSKFYILPIGSIQTKDKIEVDWRGLKSSGDIRNRIEKLRTSNKALNYWVSTSVRREFYPEDETLPGHSITIAAPFTVQNLLPVDLEIRINDQIFAITSGKLFHISSIDVTKDFKFTVATDRLTSVSPYTVTRDLIDKEKLEIKLRDNKNRFLDLYGNIKPNSGSSFCISLWVPYWIVNKSGIPLVIKQEASQWDAAGQMEDHERAKDRHPIMFSFAAEGCPHQCVVRVGKSFVKEPGFKPKYSSKFSLHPGVQAIKLKLEHSTLPTLYYNIGVEVRAGTGRYKDTQVVLLTSRFLINNQSSHSLFVCQYDLTDRPSEHILVSAQSQSSLVWNEKIENQRMLCVRRNDVRHWSCPFRLDRVSSFHVTMRDADETPQFVRVEIALSSAVFCITFTDASYYPPPIRIENLSDVPVLYQQQSENIIRTHLRTICKARSHVDYAWDDLYGNKLIVLQVYENKSHVYDPAIPGAGSKLVYENHIFIQLSYSFNEVAMRKSHTEEYELVLETLQKGKVVLNKQNKLDANGCNQLWKLCDDGCIENVGMSARSRVRMVLEMLDKMGNQLMMTEQKITRDKYQKWIFSPDGRLSLQHFPKLMLTAKGTDVLMSEHDKSSAFNEDGVAVSQQWKSSRQRPGSGTLCVECLHRGPTMIIQIRDEEVHVAQIPRKALSPTGYAMDIMLTMRAGLGISLVNGQCEELLYAHFGGIVGHGRIMDNSYQTTVSVDIIQIDNQLLDADTFKVVFCQAELPDEVHIDLPPGVPSTARPALKLEMNCCPQNNYTAFECFRLRLCNLQVSLNELLLWKLVQFAQATDAASSVQEKTLSLPPNTELERPDPLKTRRLYFGTLDLEMGQISLSVATVPKSSLPLACRQLKQQFNVKLISFENATVSLPPFRQFHYFESSAFLFETMQKFYFAELSKQVVKFVFTLDAFGNPQGFITEMKDSFQGLLIEGDVQKFVAGLGYGVSNSISKVASSLSSGVGSFTYDQNHEARRRNMVRSQSSSSTPLTHLYSGVKALGIGVIGGASAIVTNTMHEGKKSGYSALWKGIWTGAVDTITKPVQGVFDLVEGTASAIKTVAGSGASQHRGSMIRVRPPRVCRDLYNLLPAYSESLAKAQMEMLRINGFSTKERLLDMETCLEQILNVDHTFCQYALISTKQVYICQQEKDEPSTVIQRLAYKYIRHVQAKPELTNTLAHIELMVESYDHKTTTLRTIWCSRFEVARRLSEKLILAKHEYEHNKRSLAIQKE